MRKLLKICRYLEEFVILDHAILVLVDLHDQFVDLLVLWLLPFLCLFKKKNSILRKPNISSRFF